MNLGLCKTKLLASEPSVHPPRSTSGFPARLFASLALAAALLGLLSQSALATNITLAWDPSPDTTVVSYNLYYGLSSGNYTTVLSTTSTTVTVSNLTAGVTYYFAVTSVDGNGLESTFSPEITYTPPVSGAAPTLQITTLPNGQVLLTASGPTGQSYDLLASRNGGAWQVVGTGTLDGSGAFQFTNSFGANYNSCLYRLRGK